MSWDKVDKDDWQTLWKAYQDIFINLWYILSKSCKIMFWWIVGVCGKFGVWIVDKFDKMDVDKLEKKFDKTLDKWSK